MRRSREVRIARAYAFLTREQEQTATEEQLILSHGSLVLKAAQYFKRFTNGDIDDLFQAGQVGLAVAARKYDRSSGIRFSTYAQFWVRQMMREHCALNQSVVRPKTPRKGLSAMFRAGVPVDVSMDKPVTESGLTLNDTLVDPSPRPDEQVEESIDAERKQEALKRALRGLTKRESEVIRSRFLRPQQETLETIAGRMGISKERVRQIEKASIAKLRDRLRPSFATYELA